MLDPAQIGAFVDKYGLPLTLIAVASFLVYRALLKGGLIVMSGAQRKVELKAWSDRDGFQERLRVEEQGRTAAERAGRMKAEERLQRVVETVAPALEELKTLLGALEKEVIRAGRRGNGS